ncbi:phenylpropionate dioxygenase-like ring-hydroxylating dioxygenase large terminal subunit [Litorivivens lipolytica]|uniref:cholesterol 7-desaturase n=1 Tax=Litorivivens lipolytica TaxID=1524264 RepID=A0A7W4W831_9GAMM|nr:Rieske 2Fe-2S domain-containing protein [Litorivivens lipolytica]MBB3048567.1 phenylpropionate dioxygenase-like ring-hydroxylating dioxygenase large terminal subunit [Litorivivens lipolytica]
MAERIPVCESKTTTTPEFPMGWYSVARSQELQVGEVKRVRAFDRELALYRSRSGVAVIQDAFCPHLGAHLGVEGRVVGESLACPFHGWRFDTSGKCVEIPYCEEIPDRARIRMWPTDEANGEIYMWYHPENTAPEYELPRIAELNDANWAPPRMTEFEVPAHIQDIAENTCDPVHFQYVHRQLETPPSEVTVDDDGRRLYLRADARHTARPHQLDVTLHQPGLALVRTTYAPGAEMIVYNSAQPIDDRTTLLRWTLSVRREIEDLAGDEVIKGIIDGIKQDYPIWANKVHRRRPIFCKEDHTLVTYRKWVRQFYPDAAEA